MTKDAKAVAEWDFDRIIMCHGVRPFYLPIIRLLNSHFVSPRHRTSSKLAGRELGQRRIPNTLIQQHESSRSQTLFYGMACVKGAPSLGGVWMGWRNDCVDMIQRCIGFGFGEW